MTKISIIIPTLNEEECLPKLLESIKKQTFKDYEIIVADAGSKDNTLKIAKRYGAKTTKGGMPAAGRNAGAKEASGDFLFFFDADIKLPKDFLKKAYAEMQNRYLDLATCEVRPLSNLAIDKALYDLTNLLIKITQFSDKPYAPGYCIMTTKRLFQRAKGFDETLKMAEDHDFVKRASKFRQIRFLETPKAYVSVRRLRKEGRLQLLKKYMLVEIRRIFKGEIKDEAIKYEFANYRKKESPKSALRKLENNISLIGRKYSKFSKKYLNIEKLSRQYRKNMEEFMKEIEKKTKELKNKFKK